MMRMQCVSSFGPWRKRPHQAVILRTSTMFHPSCTVRWFVVLLHCGGCSLVAQELWERSRDALPHTNTGAVFPLCFICSWWWSCIVTGTLYILEPTSPPHLFFSSIHSSSECKDSVWSFLWLLSSLASQHQYFVHLYPHFSYRLEVWGSACFRDKLRIRSDRDRHHM